MNSSTPFSWGKKEQDQLILDHLQGAKKEAARVFFRFNGTVEMDILESIATLALVLKARKFDPIQGGKFWNYACPYIRGQLLNYVSRQ